jgi:hypothetical protein
MAGTQKELFEKMGRDIPRKRTSQPWAAGNGIAIILDSEQMKEWGMTPDDDDFPELTQYVHEQEGKIVIEKPDS